MSVGKAFQKIFWKIFQNRKIFRRQETTLYCEQLKGTATEAQSMSFCREEELRKMETKMERAKNWAVRNGKNLLKFMEV